MSILKKHGSAGAGRSIPFERWAFLLLIGLAGCQSADPGRLNRSLDALRERPDDVRAQAAYRKETARILPGLLRQPVAPFSEIELIRKDRATVAGLHRDGAGLPVVGVISPEKPGEPHAPRDGFRAPATALVLPSQKGSYRLLLADPEKASTVSVEGKDLPLAMNLEAPLDADKARGPSPLDGIRFLLRVDLFSAPSQLSFLEPYDPNKTPVVFVHGLLSTPLMWEPVVKELMANKAIRDRYQFWFFYYPTGQPVPLSALQLREALTSAARHYRVKKKMVLVGHSMGGIIARSQVSRETEAEAVAAAPVLAQLPADSLARRAMIFEPRTDVKRVIFFNTPHRGSQTARSGIAGLGIRLIRLPVRLLREVNELRKDVFVDARDRVPTSIQDLSSGSPFLEALNRRPPSVPHHSILGDRGRGDGAVGSDGVVPYTSGHLASAESELVVPSGHGSHSHPQGMRELKRILLEYR